MAAAARATPRGTPSPMPTFEEELRAVDTAEDSAGLLVEDAAVGLVEEELVEVVVVAWVLPEVAVVESEFCVAALAIELALWVAELASARAAAVGEVSNCEGNSSIHLIH